MGIKQSLSVTVRQCCADHEFVVAAWSEDAGGGECLVVCTRKMRQRKFPSVGRMLPQSTLNRLVYG
jgi:hypothetical protein